MLMFTLAISCLTTSNLLWFMDLTFQVPMQYCSSQHRTLLLSPIPSTTGYCFCFGSNPSFFLELLLHWSPVAYWAHTDLGSSFFSVLFFCLFGSVHGVLKARILKWLAILFSSEPCFVRTLHHDPNPKTRQRCHTNKKTNKQKKTLQANITDEDRCKNP